MPGAGYYSNNILTNLLKNERVWVNSKKVGWLNKIMDNMPEVNENEYVETFML